MKQLHLDSEYKNRYQLYHLADGQIADSRFINWRQVDWEKVIKVESILKNFNFQTICNNKNFKFFLIFRWGGSEWIDGKRFPINVWTQGWSDGSMAFLSDLDFKLCKKVKDYIEPVAKYENHIHPRVKNLQWKNNLISNNFGPFFNLT